MDPDALSTTDALRAAFTRGLERMLRQEQGLGPFILVLANATFDPAVRRALGDALPRRFMELAEACRSTLAAGRPVREPEDDLWVFLKLMAIGLDALRDGDLRQAGPWEVRFNQIRALRPPRAAGRPPRGLHVPFDPAAFHFNKPFLRREVFWQGRLDGVEAELLFNKFPFVTLHGLLVPDRERCAPQCLGEAAHHWLWGLTARLAGGLPGLGFGYNSLGAYASINHLHFQMFLRETPLPVAGGQWSHNGGSVPYPARCERFEDAEAAWARIADLHRTDICYNLIYLSGCLYCLPRRRQGEYPLPSWCGGHAWYEMAGGVVAFNGDDFRCLEPTDVDASLAAAGIVGAD